MRMWLLLVLGTLILAGPALTGEWTEDGDAIDLPPGQATVGDNPLTAIHGELVGSDDADMYCIYIADPAAFSATTCGLTTIDTQLFLFDADGFGVSFNDDDPSGCGLQSTVTGAFMPGPGLYLLAISTFDWDAAGAGGDIWEDTPYGEERPPDGPGAPGPITGWGGFGSSGSYSIGLTGADFCDSPTATEQTTWGQLKSLYR